MIRRMLSACILLSALVTMAEPPALYILPNEQTTTSDPVVGCWQISPDGAIFEVSPSQGQPGVYSLTLLRSELPEYPTGLLFGELRATRNLDTFDAWFSKDPLKGISNRGKSSKTFIAKISTSGSMDLSAYHTGYRLKITRLFPYFFRGVVENTDRPGALDGAIRLAPHSTAGYLIF